MAIIVSTESDSSPGSNPYESSVFYDKIFLEIARDKEFDYHSYGENKISQSLASNSLNDYLNEYININNQLPKYDFVFGFTK